jgi:hypothetical protein
MGIRGLMTIAGVGQGLEAILRQRLAERELALREQQIKADAERQAKRDAWEQKVQESLWTRQNALDQRQRDQDAVAAFTESYMPGAVVSPTDPNLAAVRRMAPGLLRTFKGQTALPPDVSGSEMAGTLEVTPPPLNAGGLERGAMQVGAGVLPSRPITSTIGPDVIQNQGTQAQRWAIERATEDRTFRKEGADAERAWRTAENEAARQARADEAQANRDLRFAIAERNRKDDITLTPEGLALAADYFKRTGQMPQLGMGAAGARTSILNEAGKTTTGADLAGASAGYAADKASALQLTKRYNAMQAYANQATLSLEQARKAAASYPRTGIPLVNRYKNWANNTLKGSAPLSNLEVFVYTAARDYARVTTGGAESVAQMTDTANEAADHLLNTAQTPAAFNAALEAMAVDMANATSTLKDQLDLVRGGIAGAARSTPQVQTPAPTGGATIEYVRDANGRLVQKVKR